MSIIAADLLTNVAGTGSPNIQGGELSRTRYNLNGTGVIAVRDSFNVSSFVDNGTGNYDANFQVASPNTDYSAVTNARITGTILVSAPAMEVSTTSFVRVFTTSVGSTPTATDAAYVLTAVFGDKP